MTGWAFLVFLVSCFTWCGFWLMCAAGIWGNSRDRSGSFVFAAICGVISLVLTFVALFPLQWYTTGFIRFFIFHLLYMGAGFWLGLLLVALGALVAGGLVGLLFKSVNGGVWTGVVLFVLGFFGWGIGLGIMNDHLKKSAMYGSLEYEVLRDLPDTTAIRYLPLEVARRYGENRLQESGIALGDAEPVVSGNSVDWLLPRMPNGFWNEWKRHSDGFAVVDASGSVKMIRQQMKYGEGMKGTDGIVRQLRAKRYWSNVSEIYYVESPEGEVVAVAPYINYRLKFPVRVPYWGGVFLLYADGRIEDLSPEEAMRHSLLQGVRIFPEKLARLYVDAYAYKDGIGNAMFRHKDQIRIPSVSTLFLGNEMPFLLPTQDGQKWFVAAVPWKANGINRVFLVDAITGRIHLYELGIDSALIGPERARDYVISADRYVDWDKFVVLEPRPIMRAGVLYWMFTITPVTFADVTDTVLVNARTDDVLKFGSRQETLKRFLDGEDTGRLVGNGETPSGEPRLDVPANTPGQPGVPSRDLDEIIADLERTLEELRKLRDAQR